VSLVLKITFLPLGAGGCSTVLSAAVNAFIVSSTSGLNHTGFAGMEHSTRSPCKTNQIVIFIIINHDLSQVSLEKERKNK